MAKTQFKIEIVRDYESRTAALKAAHKIKLAANQRITVFEETLTDSGQCYGRSPIWGTEEKPPPRKGYFYE